MEYLEIIKSWKKLSVDEMKKLLDLIQKEIKRVRKTKTKNERKLKKSQSRQIERGLRNETF